MMRNVTCKTTPVSRGQGHSAVGGAAYRAGENLKARGVGENGEDKWFRYSGRQLVVREAFIMAPKDAPDFAFDRGELWNTVEAMETRSNARLGREVQLGLAWELPHDEQRALVREFAQKEFVDRGFVVDVAIHNYGRTIPAIGASDEQAERIREFAAVYPMLERKEAQDVSEPHLLIVRSRGGDVVGYKLYQPHAHIRVSPRTCEDGAFSGDKYASRELNKHNLAMQWRYEWPKLQNAYLERTGSDVRVTSTSVEEDAFPDIRFLGRGSDKQVRAIDERSEALDAPALQAHEETLERAAADDAFREMHNDSIKDAFLELSDPEGSTSETGEQERQARWWHQAGARLSQWKHDFRDKAEEWRQRLAQQEWRIRSALGWAAGNTEQDVNRDRPDRGEPER